MTEPGSPKPLAKAAAVLAAIVLIAGSFSLARPGYSVDEEFTVFAVRGIQQHGLPLLPSGLLYDRGIAYSYVTAVIALGAQGAQGAQQGARDVLVAGRALSLACGLLSMLLAFILVSRMATPVAGVLAAALIASSVPFLATVTTARFYAPFLAVTLGLLLPLSTLRTTCTLRTLCTIAALSALARWFHELAFLCAAVPAVCWLLDRGHRRRWFYAVVAVVAGLLAGQAVIFALHALAPSSGETMVRRFFLWQVVNLFERPGDRQFAIPIVLMVVGWIVAPRRAWTIAVIALSGAAMILAFSIARATNSAPVSWPLVQSELIAGSQYPLDMFWSLLRLTPLTVLTALLFIAYRARHEWPPRQRAAHMLWIGWVLWFGVIESGITTNYLLLPGTFLLLAIAIDAMSTRLPRVAIAALALIVGVDQWRGNSLDAARPTIVAEGIGEVRAGIQPTDRIACTDELGCLMLVGRIDRWLALDDYVRERFIVQGANGAASGVYTGVPAAFRPADLFEPNADGTLPDRVLVVDVFKDYPIGNSRSWLPKAIEEDGLQVVPLLETPQARVLAVSPPERVATASVGASPERR